MSLKGLSPYSMSVVLAYCEHYTPKFLPGRSLSPTHLRRMSEWLRQPMAGIRSVKSHPRLAAHLTIGISADLLTVNGGFWQPTPFVLDFLKADHETQIDQLLDGFQNREKWKSAITKLSLHELFKIDYLAYLQQQLTRQTGYPPPRNYAGWMNKKGDGWELNLPTGVPLETLFHLLQMGHWSPGKDWKGTAISIGIAAQQGYSLTLMEAVLTNALGKPLDTTTHNQLLTWYQNHDAVQIRPVYLLSVKQVEHLDSIMSRRRLSDHVQQRLSQRNAIVSPQIIPGLRRKLEEMHFALDAPSKAKPDKKQPSDEATSWLALRVLAGLGEIVQLPNSSTWATMSNLEQYIEIEQLAALEHKAQIILDGIRRAIRGRDAYFPPDNSASPEIIDTIKDALRQESDVVIAYKALGELVPRYRRVEPHRLEESKSGMMYLHGYCYLAEANRVFRLDRISRCDSAFQR